VAVVVMTMSPDVRFIPAQYVDANRIESYPYQAATVLPGVDEFFPEEDSEEPIGAAYSETPEEVKKRYERMESFEKIIEQKLAQTEQIIAEKHAQAEQHAAEIAQKAYEEGYASGEKEGKTFAESQFRVHLSRLEDSLESLSGAVSLLKAASEDEVLALVTVMAEYLAAQHLETTIDAAGPLLRKLLKEHPFPLPDSSAPGEPAAVVFMHPKDLEQAQESIISEFPGIRLVQDAELSRGSLKLETADTVLDATFDRRRERLLLIVTRLMQEGQI
jgi:flagellar biosynthesis/type III secretory pathway protein FliH